MILNGGVDTGWTFYPPFSTTYSNTNVVIAGLAIFVNGFSSILTGLNFIVTLHRMRAPGMTWTRLPLFCWSHYATSVIQVLGTPVLAITLALVALERLFHIGIFDPKVGGDPVLFQHLVLVLLASCRVHHDFAEHGGDVGSDHLLLAQANLRLQLRCARLHRLSPCLGFLVWAHHLFVAGISVYAALIFSILSYFVAVPSAIKVFNWTATMFKGRIYHAHADALCVSALSACSPWAE